MEDVLGLSAEADDPRRPRVTVDECSVELHADARPPGPPAPGRPARIDYEDVRTGAANLFVSVDPTAGRRTVTVTARRTKADFAAQMTVLCDELSPGAGGVRVVLDDLTTHTAGARSEAFAPAEPRRLAAKLEFHAPPKHASWLHMAECELSVLARPCLNRRTPDAATLAAEVAAWQAARNRDGVGIEGAFKVADARKKLSHGYPLQTSAADH